LRGEENDVAQWSYGALAKLASLDMPTWFVGRELLDALRATELPADLRAADLLWPMDGLLFVLPHGSYQCKDGEMQFVTISRRYADELMMIDPVIQGGRGAVNAKDSMTTTCMMSEGGVYGWNHPLAGDQTIEGAIGSDTMLDTFLMEGRVPPDDSDRYVCKEHARLAIRLMLALAARPELGEDSSLVRRSKRNAAGKALKRDLWSPRWLGRSYHPKSENGPAGGTHASPRFHRRRGHIRVLRPGEGKRWKAEKSIWLEPTLVNPA